MSENENDIKMIHTEIASMRREIHKFIEHSNEQNIERLIREMRVIFSKPLMEFMIRYSNARLEHSLDPSCENRDSCIKTLSKLLTETAQFADRDHVSKELVDSYWERLNDIYEAQPDRCSGCLNEVSDCYGKQIEVLKNLHIYTDEEIKEKSLVDMPVDYLVTDVCEPLAHKQRFTIIKALATESKSFSELSQLTGLRAGNLLYHLQKLLDTDLILQVSERGDYAITAKGYTILQSFTSLFLTLKA